jgi:hypothetical protein
MVWFDISKQAFSFVYKDRYSNALTDLEQTGKIASPKPARRADETRECERRGAENPPTGFPFADCCFLNWSVLHILRSIARRSGGIGRRAGFKIQ